MPDQRLIEFPWTEEKADAKKQRLSHPTIPLGWYGGVVDVSYQGYLDGGLVRKSLGAASRLRDIRLKTDLGLYRWEDTIPFCAPAWDWKNNKRDNSSNHLEFPRVLAFSASKRAAYQPVDGNLGLAVPGYGHFIAPGTG